MTAIDEPGTSLRSGPGTPRVRRVTSAVLPTRSGTFTAIGYEDEATGAELVALVHEPLGAAPLVRVHSECLTGDALGSLRCDCGPQLQAAMDVVAHQGGVVVYVRGHEGRGIGLLPKLAAYALQDAGADTVEANIALGLPVDAREYGGAAAVLHDLGLASVQLLTNNPEKVLGLREHGVDVTAAVPLSIPAGEHNAAYLTTKRIRMGHDLPVASAD